MSDERAGRVLDAAYQCVLRHGVRKTTMEDIAAAAGMSRPAVYQYVRNKEDAFRRLAARIFDDALARARAAAERGTLTQRLDRILAVKLGVSHDLLQASPHAPGLIGAPFAVDLDRAFTADMTDLLTETIIEAAGQAALALADDHAREVAELTLALTRGLEAELPDPGRDQPGRDGSRRDQPGHDGSRRDQPGHDGSGPGPGGDEPRRDEVGADRTRERLRNGVALMVAGLAAVRAPAAHPSA